LQREWKGTIAVIVDECSMLRQKELYWIDERLKQIMRNGHPFGGMAVILSGDPGQIPPVQGRCLWDRSSKKGDDFSGLNSYNSMFKRCVILTEVKRIEQYPDAATFLKILDNLRNGENTIGEWHTVCTTCLRDSIRRKEWEDRFGGDQDVTYLFTTNKEVTTYNHSRLKQLDRHSHRTH
jgi:hypothetical protein